MMEKAFRVLVLGRVQGVGFRYFAHREAIRFDIKGYVKNRPDGKVEILAVGEETAIENFIQVIRTGPRFGYVDDVQLTPLDTGNKYSSFTIEY